MRDFGSIIYIDSSIRFKSGQLNPLFSVLPKTGMLTQFIGLKLTKYTDPQMFEWFGQTASDYNDFFTIEANIFMFEKTFLTAIMIKAWVTCALVWLNRFFFFHSKPNSKINANILNVFPRMKVALVRQVLL